MAIGPVQLLVLGFNHPNFRALPLLPWVMRAVSVVAGTGRRR